jgi:small ligand-binding sensory domain FIST
MPFAAALSEHPVAAEAVGEVLGSIVEQRGVEPDLVVVFASAAHVEFLGEISSAIRKVLRPGVLVGSAASAVVGGGREVEDVPALSVWAAWSQPVRPVRLWTRREDDVISIEGVPADLPDDATVLLLADPFSFPADGLADQLAAVRPDVTVVGGLASAAAAPGGNALVLDDTVHRDGAVGVVIGRDQLVGPVVSQGCRPIGEPLVVTGSDRNFLLEIAGRPALERLTGLAADLPPDERVLLSRGVHLGVAIDEARHEFGRGDFLVRNILGADKDKGVLAVGDHVPVGTTVQFHVRDAESADEDLHDLLTGVTGDAALLFTCNGRGSRLFGVDDHDAGAVVDHLGTRAVAGMFCAGELGPVGGRSFLHGFTASVLIFTDD